MLISLYSIAHVHGGWLWALLTFLCTAIYLVVCLLSCTEHSWKARLPIFIGLLCGEIICDVLWYLIYFPGGVYFNYGLGGIGGLLLWPFLLMGIGALVVNKGKKHELEETPEQAMPK